MSTSPTTYEREAFLHEIQAQMDLVIPGMAGSSADLVTFLQQVRDQVVRAAQTTLQHFDHVSRPFQFDQPWLDALQSELRSLREGSTTDHALAELLKPLRQQGLVAGPEPRIRLRTPRVLAVSLHPQRIWCWNDILPNWEGILLSGLNRELPRKVSRQHKQIIQRMLDQAAWETEIGLVIEGGLLYDRLGRAIAFTKLANFNSGFITLSTRGGRQSTSVCPTNPFPLNLASQALVQRYLLLRARWGHIIGDPLEFSNPDAFLFHNAIRSESKAFHAWLASVFPASPHPQITPPRRGYPKAARKVLQRPKVADIVDACRAASIFEMWPLLISDRSGLQTSRPPTRESWNQFALGRSTAQSGIPNCEKQNPHTSRCVPLAALTDQTSACEEDTTPTPLIDLEQIFSVIDPIDEAVRPLLRQLGTTTPRSLRRSLATSVSAIIANAPPCLDGCISNSTQAPISNFILSLQWLRFMLAAPKSCPDIKELAPNTIRRYFGAVRRALIVATEELNLLSITEGYDSIGVVAQALAGDSTSGAKKNTKDGFLHFFRFLEWEYKLPTFDSMHPELWLPNERAPYPLLLPHQVDVLINAVSPAKSTIAILASYSLERRTEIAALNLKDLHHSCADLRLSIRHSKTNNGRRDAPLLALLPAHYRTMVLEYWDHRWESVRDLPKPLEQPFLVDEAGNRFTDDRLGKAINTEIKEILGADYSLHSLRHAGASWLLLAWFVLCYGRPPASTIGPDLSHPLFSDEHLAQVRRLILGEATGLRSKGRIWGTDFLHVLRTLMGHARSSTTVDTYIQSLPLLQYYFLLKNPANLGFAQAWKELSLQQAANLLACSTTEARTRLHSQQLAKRPRNIRLQTIVQAQRAVLASVKRRQARQSSPADNSALSATTNLPSTSKGG